jgi:hypothetical protein
MLFRNLLYRLLSLLQAKTLDILHSKLQDLDETLAGMVRQGASVDQIHQAATAIAAELGATPLPARAPLHERANHDQQQPQRPAQRQLFPPLRPVQAAGGQRPGSPQQPSGALQRLTADFTAAAAQATQQGQYDPFFSGGSAYQDPYTGVLHSTAGAVARVPQYQHLSTTSTHEAFLRSFSPSHPLTVEQQFQSTVGRVLPITTCSQRNQRSTQLPVTTNSQRNQRSTQLPTPIRELVSAAPLRSAPAAFAAAQYGAQAAGPDAAAAAPGKQGRNQE